MAATMFAVTVDCPDPAALARFYQALTGGELEHADDDFARLRGAVRLDFQRVSNPPPSPWPDPTAPQRVHLDFRVDDLAAEERRAMELGATLAEEQPGGQAFRVFQDPAGHTFCLVNDA